MTSSQLDGHDSDALPETYVKAQLTVTTFISKMVVKNEALEHSFGALPIVEKKS